MELCRIFGLPWRQGIRALAALALLCATMPLASPGFAADAGAEDAPVALPQITVEAQRQALKRTLDSFVKRITYAGPNTTLDPLALWRTPVCVQAVGLRADLQSMVETRLAEIVRLAKVPVAAAPCQANFVMVVTQNPEAMLDTWYHQFRHIFTAEPFVVRKFIAKARPVRVWYDLASMSSDGAPGDAANALISTSLAPAASVSGAAASRIRFNVVPVFRAVIAIVDTDQAKGLTLRQLTDYVGMAGLSKIDFDADLDGLGSAPTILKLFAPGHGDALPGLTEWDTAYLQALYSTHQDIAGQRFDIATQMLHSLAH